MTDDKPESEITPDATVPLSVYSVNLSLHIAASSEKELLSALDDQLGREGIDLFLSRDGNEINVYPIHFHVDTDSIEYEYPASTVEPTCKVGYDAQARDPGSWWDSFPDNTPLGWTTDVRNRRLLIIELPFHLEDREAISEAVREHHRLHQIKEIQYTQSLLTGKGSTS